MTEFKKIKRRLRHIAVAQTGHGYCALYFAEYVDTTFKFLFAKNIKINETSVHKRDIGTSDWEESCTGAPGWFKCPNPNFLNDVDIRTLIEVVKNTHY